MRIVDWIEIGPSDELGCLDTPVHRLDARAKAIVVLAFVIVVMSFPRREISALTPFVICPVVLISLGHVPVRHILKKILVAMPLALVIGMFNPILDRQPVAALGPLVITDGWISFVSILLRFILTVSAALALIACTGMVRLGVGLGQLGVPRVFVVQLLLLHRYLYVVADEGGRMMRAVAVRADGKRSLGFRVYGALVGHLLLRSLDRAGRVHRAMVARGFAGEIQVSQRPSFRWSDGVFVFGWLTFFAVARAWDLADALGRAFIRIAS